MGTFARPFSLRTRCVSLFISPYSTFWFQTRTFFLQQTGASREIPHYVIAKATYMQEVNAACAQLSQCATRKFPLQQLRRNPGTATAASCCDAATHTKEILIAPRDGNLQSDPWMGKRRRLRDMVSEQTLVSVVQVRRCGGGATLTHCVTGK